jgi:mannose-6-phosphate isomerase class I
MLTYRDGPPEIMRGNQLDSCTTVYIPPIDEFLLERMTIARGTNYSLKVSNAPSIILVYEGSGNIKGHQVVSAKRGTAVFVIAGANVECQATEDMTILKCTCKI